jgi:hypothetical protein
MDYPVAGYVSTFLNWVIDIEDAEASMRVSDRLLKCVVFIGVERNNEFVPLGTGFIVALPEGNLGFQYIVTALHVIAGVKETILVRLNKSSGKAANYTLPRGWYYHPDPLRLIDVAVAPVALQSDLFDFAHVHVDHFCDDTALSERDIGIGEELFYPGLFMAHRGVGRNLPVMRFGTLAAMPNEPVRTRSGPIKAYLMEGRSIGGHSGSPVFINFLAPRTYYADRVVSLPHPTKTQGYRLLGLIRGYLRAKDSGEYTTEQPKIEEDLWVNSGISTIIPAQEIIETIMQDELKDQRAADAKRHNDQLADVPTSARSTGDSETSDNDANPNHLKDFMRLVDVAARKRPQGDQT